MSVHSLKRSLLFSFLTLLAANGAFAVSPSARYETRMVWDTAIHRAVLFGGLTALDAGTKIAYELGDTWQWTGTRWIETFPAHSPSARSGHLMVYDSARNRIVVFGGRHGKTNLNDTWSYDGNDWTQLFPPTSPSVRELTGQAYDSARDRIVMFGGYLQTYSADGNKLTETPLHDTWEFDGTTWKQILSDGPNVIRPTLEYDPVRKQTIMIAAEPDKSATQMYAWDPVAAKWNQLTPSVLPACALGGEMTWQNSDNTILYTGAVCADSASTEDTYEWDGTNWTKIDLLLFVGRYFGSALTFDPDRQVAVLFGGATISSTVSSATFVYANKAWLSAGDSRYPIPRSLFAFTTDPLKNVIDLYGGLNESTNLFDYWTYRSDVFQFQPATTDQPSDCGSPLLVFDTDRQKMVMLCDSSATLDFDGTAWTAFDTSKKAPPQHRFAALAYDQTLKKTVFFGGYDGVSAYLNQTWVFDGTAWSQVKKNPAPFRSLTSMWWDPITKKTVLYGGLGRLTANDRLTRFSDMWSFDGTGWLEIKPAATPGMRYGMSVVVDPKTGHAFIFGGVRVDTDANNIQTQVYANDMWEWDGATWTKVTSSILTPPARENAGFAADPLTGELVLFGGYSGTYLSDAWSFSKGQWKQVTETLNRRRSSR
ncbi:MAG TPA: kelch repeat-containing protein [Thermoanaerobaculia bacterium]|jgi:hypothetical protein|nr:kelch repeat-containing protein [Thermoanaerobaculia bacterium]